MHPPYTYRFDDVDSTTSYVGKAVAGSDEASPVWRIARFYTSGTLTEVKFAGGTGSFNYAWQDRAGLSYY